MHFLISVPMPVKSSDQHYQVGYDYAAAVIELLRVMTYEELARYLGYNSKGAISKVLDGAIPSHVQGEALWALYRDTFNKKPPMNVRQSGQSNVMT